MSEREPLLPTHAKNLRKEAAQYGSQLKRDAKRTSARYGIDPEDPVASIREAAPSREKLFHIAQLIGAVKAGKLPSQQQISGWIELILSSPVLDERSVAGSTRLSQQGAKVIQDLKGLLACVERIGESKNSDNKIQKFIWQTTQASADVTSEGRLSIDLPSSSTLGADGLGAEAQQDARRILNNVKQMGQLMLTSSEFRNLLADIQFLLRDLTADAASEAARKAGQAEGKIRPSERERKSRGEEIEIRAPTKKDVKAAAERAKGAVREAGTAGEGAAKWLDEHTPDDAKDEFVERVRDVIARVQQDSDFKDALNAIYSIGNKWIDIVQSVAEKAKEKTDVDVEAPEVEANANLREAVDLLTEILETFSGRSLNPVKDSFGKISEHVRAIYEGEASKETKELREFIEDVQSYIDRALNQDGFIQSNRASRQASELYDRAQSMLKASGKDANKELNKLKKDFDECMDEVTTFFEGFEEDSELNELGRRVEKLGDDLKVIDLRASFSAGGGGLPGFLSSLRQEGGALIRDLVEVMVPRVLEEIEEVPFPRMEWVSREADIVIDDLSLRGSTISLLPDRVRVVNRNELTLEQRRSSFGSQMDAHVYLEVDGLRVKAADVAYYIHKKTGWVGWEDYGLLDLDLGGRDGTKFVVKLSTADEEDSESFFKVEQVSVDMSSFKCKVRQTKHWLLNFFLMPFVRPTLRKVVQQLLEKQIAGWLQNSDRWLWGVQQRAKVINNYSKLAVAEGKGISAKAYTKAIFSPDSDAFSPYGSSSRRGATHTEVGLAEGVVVEGVDEGFKLAIGASYSKQLLPGRGGPFSYAQRRMREYEELERSVREGVRQVKESVEEAREGAKEAVEEVRQGAKEAAEEAKKGAKQVKKEAKKAEREADREERRSRRQNGWQSNVFDVQEGQHDE